MTFEIPEMFYAFGSPVPTSQYVHGILLQYFRSKLHQFE